MTIPRIPLIGLLLLTHCALPHAAPRPTVARPGSTGSVNQGVASMSDAEIVAAVRVLCQRDPGRIPESINVASTQGIVELSGTVSTVLSQRRAVHAAKSARGVRSVMNRLELELPPVLDSQLANAVSAALKQDEVMHRYDIATSSVNGEVTLDGKVRSWHARRLAQWLAEGVPGTKEVDNRVAVEARAVRGDEELAADVASRLRWNLQLDSPQVEVGARGGTIFLRGSVASTARRGEVVANAWVIGVHGVDDSGLIVQPHGPPLLRAKTQMPVGYQIATAIGDAAAYDPRVSAADVHPLVSGTAVLLRGSVASEPARRAVQQIAEDTPGVAGVVNQLRIQPAQTVRDAQLLSRALDALGSNAYTRGLPISVAVTARKAIITGKVRTAFERRQATKLVASIEGVRDVDNDIEVGRFEAPHRALAPVTTSSVEAPSTPARGDQEVASAIERRLHANPLVDGSTIAVEVLRGIATLNGTVASTSARMATTLNAYEGGASFVDNRIRVDGLD